MTPLRFFRHFQEDENMTNEIYPERYNRQVALQEIGATGQQKLAQAKVLVIGAGGLGCPALLYLAAAGVGTLGVADYDYVDITNLHRQILYTTEDLGKPKAETAAKRLRALNPDLVLHTYDRIIENKNALSICSGYDLILDGSDNYVTRYLVNDACVLLGKPLIYGAAMRFEGQAGVFNLLDPETNVITNYRDLFPFPPEADPNMTCEQAGVIGVLPGIIGTLQATEALKIITGIGKPLANRVLTFNILTNSFYEFNLLPRRERGAEIPGDEDAFRNFDYESFCGLNPYSEIISTTVFTNAIKDSTLRVVDVREWDEPETDAGLAALRIPMSEFNSRLGEIPSSLPVVFICQWGLRSRKAMADYLEAFPGRIAYSLAGGIAALQKKQNKNPHRNEGEEE
jgi:adenylyltransferase/sulfurtransferase